jgi:hypothetical protein
VQGRPLGLFKNEECLETDDQTFAVTNLLRFGFNFVDGRDQWKGINHKQSTRWQHLSQLKASAFFTLQNFFSCNETQQLILGTGTAIWWVTEPHNVKI